jgi:hypothetical protein
LRSAIATDNPMIPAPIMIASQVFTLALYVRVIGSFELQDDSPEKPNVRLLSTDFFPPSTSCPELQ